MTKVSSATILPARSHTNSRSFKSLLRRVLDARDALPLSTQGFFLLLVLAYLYFVPITRQNDIVAAVLALSIGALILLCFLGCAWLSLSLRRSASVEVFLPDTSAPIAAADDTALRSGREFPLAMRVDGVRLLPFFHLELALDFEEALSAFHISGSVSRSTLLIENVRVPHRGMWKLRGVDLSVADFAGITEVHRHLRSERTQKILRVFPPQSFANTFPIISSAERPGDMLVDATQRRGDPFDVKRYHPSDGLNRVVWKIFARSGELMSRHPEHAMTPEGQTLVYCLARSEEDEVCTAAVAYARALFELELTLYFACEGMGTRPIALDAAQAEELTVESAWDSEKSTMASVVKECAQLIENARQATHDAEISNIVIFAGKDRLRSQEEFDVYAAVGDALQQRGIKPVFMLVESLASRGAKLQSSTSAGLLAKDWPLKDWLIRPEARSSRPVPGSKEGVFLTTFIKTCDARQWPVFLDH